MVATATQIHFKVLASELEALLIEAELIRLHQPLFNTLLKDDKTPLYIHITDENFPRVLTVRKKDLEQSKPKGTILGPYPSSYKIKEVLKIARKIFPWCNQKKIASRNQRQKKACFYYHIGQCPGSCLGLIDKSEYQQNIKELVLFLKGSKKRVITKLKKRLNSLSKDEKFEEAALIRDRIQLIKEVTQKTYQLKPTLLLPNITQDISKETQLHLHKILSTYLQLPPTHQFSRIEGYDVSNTSGKLASVSMVTFIDGTPAKDQYRLFNIKTLNSPNDYGMLKEALQRRQNHAEWGKPDLLVIDGGKGQLRSVLQIWQWPNPVISIAKHPDRLIIPVHIERGKRLKVQYETISLPENHHVLHLVQQIRDESHRFSKQQHLKRRTKNMLS